MKAPIKKLFCCALLATTVAVTHSRAAVLVSYDFTGSNGIQVTTPVDATFANVSASSISRGSSYDPGTTSVFLSDSMGVAPGQEDANTIFLSNYTLATAAANGAYFELTITAALGYSLSIDTINLAVRRASNKSGPNLLGVRSSLDGYTADLDSGVSLSGTQAVPVNQTLNFGTSLQDITGSVTLRLYGYQRNQSSASYGIWAMSNHSVDDAFTVNGTISPIPEPTMIHLLGLAGLGFVLLRRRRTCAVS